LSGPDANDGFRLEATFVVVGSAGEADAGEDRSVIGATTVARTTIMEATARVARGERTEQWRCIQGTSNAAIWL
jgi:hypothetical protein